MSHVWGVRLPWRHAKVAVTDVTAPDLLEPHPPCYRDCADRAIVIAPLRHLNRLRSADRNADDLFVLQWLVEVLLSPLQLISSL